MAYTHTNFGVLKDQLAERLGDPSKIFWVDAELGIYLAEALSTFGVLSAFWRERGVVTANPGLGFYKIDSELPNLLGYTTTDHQLIQALQYYLLEDASSQQTWNGTPMFTLADLAEAVQRRRNQFLADTGIVLNRSLVNVAPSQIGREQLADDIIDVRRAAWLGASPFNYYTHLWREDERALTAYNTSWSVSGETPGAYSVMAPPPIQLQLAPPPLASGQLELITVDSGAALTPSSAATVLGIPNDLVWVVKWGALADLLGKDGEARDAPRAQFAELRYRQGVALARMLPVVVHAEINGVPLLPCSLESLDAGDPNWQNTSGFPTDIAIAGANIIGLYPAPDTLYSVTLDVVRKRHVPATDAEFVQVGREQVDMIIDYAEHLALFKAAGAEWAATQRAADNFLLQAVTYNQRLSAAARYVVTAKASSLAEKQFRPRRLEAEGLGAAPLVGGDNA